MCSRACCTSFKDIIWVPERLLSRLSGCRFRAESPSCFQKFCADLSRCPLRLSISRIQQPVHGGIAHDGLHVFAGFAERDRLDELVNIPIWTLALPRFHALRSGIVGCERIFHLSVEAVHHVLEIASTQLEVYSRIG